MAIRESREFLIEASRQEVLAVMLDVESLPEWSAAHRESVVLERDDEGRPLLSRAIVSAVGVVDTTVIRFRYYDDGYGWSLVNSSQQRSQEARYTLRDDVAGTRVRFDITMDPKLPVPGFILRRITRTLVDTATEGLRRRVLDVQGS